MVEHNTLTGTSLHVPQGYSPDSLTLPASTSDAFQIDDAGGDPILVVDTSGTPDNRINLWSTSQGGRLYVRLADNISPGLAIENEDGENYLVIITTTGSEVIQIGNATDNPGYEWLGSGDWTVGGGVGSSGEVLTSNGAGAAPTWQTGSSVTNLQTAYDGGNTIDEAGGLGVDITHQATATPTHYALDINYPAQAYSTSATPHGLRVDMSGATSLITTGSSNTYGARLTGITDGGTADTIGLYLDGSWDVPMSFSGPITITGTEDVPGNSTGTASIMIGGGTMQCDAANSISIGFEGENRGSNSVLLGYNASIGSTYNFSTVVGASSTVGGANACAYGYLANAAYATSIALGHQTSTTTTNQIAAGDNTSYYDTFLVGGSIAGATNSGSQALEFGPPDAASTSKGWGLTLRAADGGGTSGDGGPAILASGGVTSGTIGALTLKTGTANRIAITGPGVHTYTVDDNVGLAYTIEDDGGTNYMNIDSTNAAQVVTFGGTGADVTTRLIASKELLIGASGGTATYWHQLTEHVQTTDATDTTIATVTPTDEARGTAFVYVLANDHAGASSNNRVETLLCIINWTKTGGTVTVDHGTSGTPVIPIHETNGATHVAGVFGNASSGDLQIQVRGAATTTVEWTVFIQWNDSLGI